MNVKLLRKVQKVISEEAKRFDMSQWAYPNPDAPCGTTACIAGWAVILSEKQDGAFKDIAQRLNIGQFCSSSGSPFNVIRTGTERLKIQLDKAFNLFYVSDWPPVFRSRYNRAIHPETKARIACQRIDHFIKTKGAE